MADETTKTAVPGWAKLLMFFKLPGETMLDIKKASEGLTDDDKREMVAQAIAEGTIEAPVAR